MLLLCNFLSTSFYGQTVSGILIGWNSEVGCQVYGQSEPPRGDKDPVLIEDIQDGQCIRVCEFSNIRYTLTGNLGSSPNTVWTVVGGIKTAETSSFCNVSWGAAGNGSITFSINTPNGIITKTICIERIIRPKALFTTLSALDDFQDLGYLFACQYQTIHFNNLSDNANGTSIVSYQWNFGDGTYSAAFEPSHIYIEPGEYIIYLTVTNSCNCSSSFRKKITIKNKGFDITCPTVVCEGQTAVYSLPFDGREICRDQYNWAVQGGEILNVDLGNGDVTVLWNNVDTSGFGLVTFNPNECRLDCLTPTTIKVPVIKREGTIIGSTNLCNKEYGRYKLPQWPTTDFRWQIVGNEDGSLAEVILTDQRNEVIIRPLIIGTLTLRADYQNTLLHCGGSAEFIINVNIPAAISGPNVLCLPAIGTYTNQTGLPVNWKLKTNSGTIVTTNSEEATFTYNFTTAGGYTLSMEGSGSCAGGSIPITVVAPPQGLVSINGLLEVCPNAPYQYRVLNPQTGIQYRWEVTDGNFQGSNIGAQVTISFNTVASHQVKVFRETLNPIVCSSTPTTITVINKQILAEINASNATVCANNSYTYLLNATGTSTPFGDGETYAWSILTPNLGSITAGQGTNAISVLWNNVLIPTPATIRVEIRKCTITTFIEKQIIITPIPVISIVANASTCSGVPMQFSISSSFTLPADTQVQWNFNNLSVTGGLTINQSFLSNASNNITKIISATIANPAGCTNATATATPISVTILPGPTATNSIVSGGNAFCLPSEINTTLTAATITGATIQWFQAGSPNHLLIPGQIATSFQPTAFAGYLFVATAPNGCKTQSNIVSVYQSCGPSIDCVINPAQTLENNASNNCGILNLAGSATGTPLNSYWSIVGPNANYPFYTDTSLLVRAGVYQTFYNAQYPCASGGSGTINAFKEIIVPYVPKFSFTKVCVSNNSFTISLVDNSDFYSPVDNRTFEYSYRRNNGGVWSSWTVALTTANGTIATNLNAGTYQIRLVIQGTLNGVLQTPCEVVIQENWQKVLPVNIVIFNQILCHDTPVIFKVNPPNAGDTFLWTFDAGAQNTLAIPTRVFNTSGTQSVQVVVTNSSGCSANASTTVTIPTPCFAGDIVTYPASASVCSGQTITTTYIPAVAECAATEYIWMDGNNPIDPPVNSPTINLQNNGFYWLKLKSANNCQYNTPTVITPIFKTPPSVVLSSPGTLCYGSDGNITANTTATSLVWTYNNGNPIPWAYNQKIVYLSSFFTPGTYLFTVTVTENGCSTTATQEVTIVEAPEPPSISYDITSCNPFRVTLKATSSAPGTFNWSNGNPGTAIPLGNQIIVTEGGPYQVRFTVGGCSTTAQLDVPKNPENFSWIFPTGCITVCEKFEGTIIGPRLPLPYWGWNLNDTVLNAGQSTFAQPLLLQNSGNYTLQYNTVDNNPEAAICSLTTQPLIYTIKESCKDCGLKEITLRSAEVNDTRYCSFTIRIGVTNATGSPITVTLGSIYNQAVFAPNTLTIAPGTGSYEFIVIPLSPFTGGAIQLVFYSLLNGKECMTDFSIRLPYCTDNMQQGKENNQDNKLLATVILAPNPARNEVTLTYGNLATGSSVSLYDLAGRELGIFELLDSTGTLVIPTQNYPSGIYLVVVYNTDGVQAQKKLIIN